MRIDPKYFDEKCLFQANEFFEAVLKCDLTLINCDMRNLPLKSDSYFSKEKKTFGKKSKKERTNLSNTLFGIPYQFFFFLNSNLDTFKPNLAS